MTSTNKLVVKDNALIDASFNLSLIEQRIMLLAIVEARESNNLSPDTPIEVSVNDYIDQVSDFKSKYSIRLYELIIKWLSVTKTEKYSINDLRSKLGLGVEEYSTMSNFKSNVLDKAISEINKHTDITVDYQQFKKGRVITDIQFSIKSKARPSKQKNTIKKSFYQMNDAQINLFGNQLSRLHELSHLANQGESYEELAIKIKDMLRDPIQQKQLLPHLKDLGFKA